MRRSVPCCRDRPRGASLHLVAGLIDGGADGLLIELLRRGDRHRGIAPGVELDGDVADTRQAAELFLDSGLAVSAGHSRHCDVRGGHCILLSAVNGARMPIPKRRPTLRGGRGRAVQLLMSRAMAADASSIFFRAASSSPEPAASTTQ